MGLVAGSLIVLAVAGDKLADAAMSALNRWAHGAARTGPDAEHPWGHGKIEAAMGLGQAALLTGIVASVLVSAVNDLRDPSPPPDIALSVAGLVLTGVVSVAISLVLARAARDDDALTLEADAAHYRVDALHTTGALIGIGLVGWTGQAWIDPLAAVVFAVFMGREAWQIGRRALDDLLDTALPADEVDAIRAVLDAHGDRVEGTPIVRTRKAGPQRFVEVHVDLDPERSLGEAHAFVQDLAAAIRDALPDNTRVLVHPDAAGRPDAVDRPLETLGTADARTASPDGAAPDAEDGGRS